VFVIFAAGASGGDTAATITAAVLAQAVLTPIDADVKKAKGSTPADLTAAGLVQVPSRWENT
jgi:hypothetical protein